jgi:hypothetical protein
MARKTNLVTTYHIISFRIPSLLSILFLQTLKNTLHILIQLFLVKNYFLLFNPVQNKLLKLLLLYLLILLIHKLLQTILLLSLLQLFLFFKKNYLLDIKKTIFYLINNHFILKLNLNKIF